MKIFTAFVVVFLLSGLTAFAQKEETAPVLGTQKHQPISVRRCSCQNGYLKDSRIPGSTCQASLHGRVQEFPVYNDICRSLEISEDWMRAVIAP